MGMAPRHAAQRQLLILQPKPVISAHILQERRSTALHAYGQAGPAKMRARHNHARPEITPETHHCHAFLYQVVWAKKDARTLI